jgi:hypothetical protein
MRQSSTISGFDGTLKDLAVEIASLKYDSMIKLFNFILFELERQSSHNKIIGKVKLGNIINKSCLHISLAIGCIQDAWELSDTRDIENRL